MSVAVMCPPPFQRPGRSAWRTVMLWGIAWTVPFWVASSAIAAEPAPVEAGGEEDARRLRFQTAPRWIPSPHVPVAGRVEFTASRPCRAVVAVDDGSRTRVIAPPQERAIEHSIVVLGLKAGRSHQLTVSLTAEEEEVTAAPLTVRTPPLPSNFPAMQLIRSEPARMEPGVTLFSVLRWVDDVPSVSENWLVMVDAQGEVVWHLRLPEPGGAVRRLPHGNLLFLHGGQPTGMREIDLLGNVVRQYRAVGTGVRPRPGEIAVPLDTFHHDCLPLPDGNILVLSTEVRRIDEYPQSELRPELRGPAHVVGDVVVEVRPDGSIARRWPLLDILDPTRIGYGSLDSFWDLRAYPFVAGGTRDWSHANSLAIDPVDDGLVVCLRHQDAVVKIDRDSAQLRWILGTPAGWREPWASKLLRPQGRLEWPFHAHGAKFTPEGTLLLFDNGNCRRLPPERPQPATLCYSRAVEYVVDETAGTVRQVWQYGSRGRDRFFSAFVGDVDGLPLTRNILITDGGRLESRTGAPLGEPPGDVQWGRLLEVTRNDPAEIVFELHVREPDRRSSYGSSLYRGERLPPLEKLTEMLPRPALGEQ